MSKNSGTTCDYDAMGWIFEACLVKFNYRIEFTHGMVTLIADFSCKRRVATRN